MRACIMAVQYTFVKSNTNIIKLCVLQFLQFGILIHELMLRPFVYVDVYLVCNGHVARHNARLYITPNVSL